ncbi:MAG TPA: alpha-amylase C-terminal beta-sheet domain-containing protein [Gemmataceae bacterium]
MSLRTRFLPLAALLLVLAVGNGRIRAEEKYNGDGKDILFQGFHWDSHSGALVASDGVKKTWYTIVKENAPAIKSAGFSWVWFPPPSDSLAPQGYLPRRWDLLKSEYGTEDQLKGAIEAIKPVRAMADVVINHRVGVATAGADFEDPRFPDWRKAVTQDDESRVGTGAPDSGDGYGSGRDLDHTNADVRAAVKDYLKRLQDVGFGGWRYDLVKGYAGKYVAEYNDATAPAFSVGEFFDTDRQKVTNWIDATGGKSTAFDFPTRYLLYDAIRTDDYGRLSSVNGGRAVPGGLIGFWPAMAVTFVDNQDTEWRRDAEHQRQNDSTRHFADKTVAMAYAYVLTHPGVPCVFWPHYFDWGPYTRERIDKLIKVRRDNGIQARSPVDIREAKPGLYAALVDQKVAVKLGSADWSPGDGWRLAVDGDKFAVWVKGK